MRESGLDPAIAARLKRTPDGLVSAVVQQAGTREVLMVAWMDDEALHRTLTTGRATYWSRSRESYWVKGDTSGHVQHVREVRLDCDGDALLVVVDQTGAACHTGDRTCFDADVLLARGSLTSAGVRSSSVMWNGRPPSRASQRRVVGVRAAEQAAEAQVGARLHPRVGQREAAAGEDRAVAAVAVGRLAGRGPAVRRSAGRCRPGRRR